MHLRGGPWAVSRSNPFQRFQGGGRAARNREAFLGGIWEEDEKGEEGIFVSAAARWEEGVYIGFAALRVGEGFATRCASGYLHDM